MINKIEFNNEPELSVELDEFFVEFKDDHSKYFPEIKNFAKYLGTWKTDTVIWDYGDSKGF